MCVFEEGKGERAYRINERIDVLLRVEHIGYLCLDGIENRVLGVCTSRKLEEVDVGVK